MRHPVLQYVCCLLMAVGCTTLPSFAQQSAGEKIMAVDSLPVAPVITNGILQKTGQEANAARQFTQQLVVPQKKLMDSLLGSAKNITGAILPVDLFKKGTPVFKINAITADIEYTYLRDTSGLSTGYLSPLQSTVGYDMNLSLSLASMPFEARVAGNNGLYTLYNTPYRNFPQFNFDHEQYLATLQKQVLGKVNPGAVLSSALSRINSIKGQYEASLRNEIKKIQQEFASEFNDGLEIPSNITDLSVNDLTSLKSAVIPQDVLNNYKQGTEMYQELNRGNYNQVQKDSLQRGALQKIKKYEALEKIYGKITGWKSKFDGNPLVKELRSHLPFTPGNFKSFIKKPGSLVDVIKGHANLSGIQRLFLNVTKLDIGSNPLSGGELNLQGLMNNGVNAEITGKRSSVGLVYGSGSSNINNWMQAGLNSVTSNEYSKLMGIKFGSGWNSGMKQSLSLNFFDFNPSQDLANMDPSMLQSGYLSNAGRRDAVITWQSSFAVSGNHKIAVDLSRSFGGYRNNLSEDSSVNKTNPFGDVFGNGGKANYAAAVEYTGDILKTNVQAYVKKAGLGYSNPGNVFVRRGETRVGMALNKKFFKQKLTVRYKTDFRSQHFDPSKNYTYSNFSNDLRLGYRFKRNTRVGIALRHGSYDFENKLQTGMATTGSNFSLQGDGSYQFRIDRRKVINSFVLSRQSFDIPMLNGEQYASKTWLVTHTSSLVLNKNLLMLVVMVNQSDNKDYYFNTSFVNTELSYAYGAGDKIRLSSGAGFYSNTGWNKQVGLKQQISGSILKKLDIDIDITWKKAVETVRKELANQVYISSSLHYRF